MSMFIADVLVTLAAEAAAVAVVANYCWKKYGPPRHG